jgi:hypothetical protein
MVMLATNWLRLMMGGLAGGLLVYLFDPVFDKDSQIAAIGPVGVGFLAGYSVDFFYQSLDKIISVVTPQSKTEDSTTMTPRQAQIESLAKLLKETSNEEDKTVIRGLLEKL